MFFVVLGGIGAVDSHHTASSSSYVHVSTYSVRAVVNNITDNVAVANIITADIIITIVINIITIIIVSIITVDIIITIIVVVAITVVIVRDYAAAVDIRIQSVGVAVAAAAVCVADRICSDTAVPTAVVGTVTTRAAGHAVTASAA
jgi:hypothetical protein